MNVIATALLVIVFIVLGHESCEGEGTTEPTEELATMESTDEMPTMEPTDELAAIEPTKEPPVCSRGAVSILYIRPQCCANDVGNLSVAELDCKDPPVPVNSTNFREVCQNRNPACCTIALTEIGAGLVCKKPDIPN